MKKPLSLLFVTLLSATLLSSCFHSSLAGLWFYTYSEGDGIKDSALTPASFLLLQKDNTYTRDFGRFEYGTWEQKDGMLVLTNQDKHMTVFPLLPQKDGDLVLDQGKGRHAEFERQHSSDQTAFAPFSREKNRWRIPATAKEDDQAIRKRLLNHCQFWEAYFNWALQNSIATIDVRSTPTLIKIYGNGFTLKPFEDLPAAWKGYFFDEEDCRKANAIIQDIFEHRNIAWPHTDNKYKFFISGFQQMEQFLQ